MAVKRPPKAKIPPKPAKPAKPTKPSAGGGFCTPTKTK